MNYKSMIFSTNVIEHLGKDLITAPEVAFIELLKNSLDASVYKKNKKIQVSYYDSLNVIEKDNLLVGIDKKVFELVPEEYKEKKLFLIEDLGCGMSENTLEKGFLAIGTDIKKKSRENNKEIILGEKGIGRLATQRLGKFLLVETASEEENHSNIVAIEWEKILEGNNISDIKIPYEKYEKLHDSYTRLWIFDVNEGDLIRQDGQIELFKDYSKVVLNEDLDNAVCFLISPFEEKKIIEISFYYNGHLINYGFDRKMLEFAESVHRFTIDVDENNQIFMKLGLDIRPWLIYRIHKSCIQPQAEFVKYKKKIKDYEKLLEDYSDKFDKSFNYIVDESELTSFLVRDSKKSYEITEKEDNDDISEYLTQRIEKSLEEVKKIFPIEGEVYSYKKDVSSCKAVLDFCNDDRYDAKKIQLFLKSYNGIKLYRDNYRIGFLGNKDNDWLKLQQYRTMGHQFYRFNLGTTVGKVTINDPCQRYIREISSRLDINRSGLSNTFMKLVEEVCNSYFYKFNEAITDMTKDILSDEGWLQGNVKQKVVKEEQVNNDLLKQNRELKKKLNKTKEILSSLECDSNGFKIISDTHYNIAIDTLEMTSEHIDSAEEYIQRNSRILGEAKAGLEKIEIEAFNNYKLMANGLITETITHELHSLVSTNGSYNMDMYFEKLNEYLWENNMNLYNKNLLPIRDTYYNVVGTLDDVSALYKFLENTFIKNNSIDEYELINIHDTAMNIASRLSKELKKLKIDIDTTDDNINWYLPKGVLLHVLYNLINNSKYWIDIRRKRSNSNKEYTRKDKDFIMIECVGIDTLIVYDTGTGVKKEMEEVLFQPLQSGKGPDGRGMGLYIVKKLLNSFGAKIELSEERNLYGNRYKFIITVPGECIQ